MLSIDPRLPSLQAPRGYGRDVRAERAERDRAGYGGREPAGRLPPPGEFGREHERERRRGSYEGYEEGLPLQYQYQYQGPEYREGEPPRGTGRWAGRRRWHRCRRRCCRPATHLEPARPARPLLPSTSRHAWRRHTSSGLFFIFRPPATIQHRSALLLPSGALKPPLRPPRCCRPYPVAPAAGLAEYPPAAAAPQLALAGAGGLGPPAGLQPPAAAQLAVPAGAQVHLLHSPVSAVALGAMSPAQLSGLSAPPMVPAQQAQQAAAPLGGAPPAMVSAVQPAYAAAPALAPLPMVSVAAGHRQGRPGSGARVDEEAIWYYNDPQVGTAEGTAKGIAFDTAVGTISLLAGWAPGPQQPPRLCGG